MKNLWQKIYAVMLLICFFGILLAVKIVNTKSTVFKNENETVEMMRSVLPEAWGFFTRNPREPSLLVFRHDGSGFALLDFIGMRNHATFNISRDARFLARETGRLMEQIKPGDWRSCRNKPVDCVQDMSVVELENSTQLAQLCGDLIFAQQELVPWAWQRNTRPILMPSKVVRINARCS